MFFLLPFLCDFFGQTQSDSSWVSSRISTEGSYLPKDYMNFFLFMYVCTKHSIFTTLLSHSNTFILSYTFIDMKFN